MTDTLYKITVQDEGLGDGGTEELKFNDTIVDAVGNAYILKVTHNKPKGVTGNQSLGQDNLDQLPEGNLGEFYTIEGVVPFMDGTIDATGDGSQSNASIDQLKAWEDGLDTTDDIIHGQFGFEFKTVPAYKLAPISTGVTQIGLLWVGLEWKFNLILNFAEFTLKLKVDKGDTA